MNSKNSNLERQDAGYWILFSFNNLLFIPTFPPHLDPSSFSSFRNLEILHRIPFSYGLRE